MSISSRITSMEQHIGNAYDKLDELGVDLTNVDKNLNNIAELLDGVYEDYPKTTTTDVTEPSINNTKAGKMEIDLKGNTEQTTYTGKNLFNQTDYTTISIGTNGSATLNASTEKITITLGTGVTTGIYITNANIKTYIQNYSNDNNYYVSMDIKATRSITMTIGGDTRPTDTNVSSTISRISVQTKFTSNGLVIYANANYQTGDTVEVTNIMISNSNNNNFEPYTGGTASPNPDYPQNVEVVSGENKVKVVNKNLFDKNDLTAGFVNADGTVGGDLVSYRTSNFILVKPNTTYYKTQTGSPRTKFYDKNKQVLDTSTYQDISVGAGAGSFTTPNNAVYFRFSFPISGGSAVDINAIQLEQGSTATPYEEHKEQDFPISLSSKNLLYFSVVNLVPSVNTGQLVTYNGAASSDFIEVDKSKIYVTSFEYDGEHPNNTFYIMYYDENKNYLGCTIDIKSGYLLNSSNYFSLSKYVKARTDRLSPLKWSQIEEGSTATEYQPYYNYELCKIGDYQDYIYKNNGSWYIKKNMGKIDLGNISWNRARHNIPNYSRYYTNTISNLKYVSSNTQVGNGLAEKYRIVKGQGISDIIDCLAIDVSIVSVCDKTTPSGLFYYALATTEDIPITDTTLISQLNALEKAKSYDDTTNIIQENNDLPFILDIKTLKKS